MQATRLRCRLLCRNSTQVFDQGWRSMYRGVSAPFLAMGIKVCHIYHMLCSCSIPRSASLRHCAVVRLSLRMPHSYHPRSATTVFLRDHHLPCPSYQPMSDDLTCIPCPILHVRPLPREVVRPRVRLSNPVRQAYFTVTCARHVC